MGLSRLLMGVWFLLYGLGYFVGIPQLGLVLAILAIILGVVILAGQ